MYWPILFLLPFTALMLGAVHPWAFGLAELVVFVLIAVWMLQVAIGKRALVAAPPRMRTLAALAIGLAALVAFQLVPMPPRVLKLLSPATYQVYREGLPGWPARAAYQWDRASLPPGSAVLPTLDEVNAGAQVPFAPVRAVAAQFVKAGAWMPLSVAAPITGVALLKLLMYCGAGLMLMFYPFGVEQETRLYKNTVRTVLATGLVIGLVGLAEQRFSNGKPLWIFSPYDWHGGGMWGARSYGPFANPDHFADYLAMVWPFALSGMLFPNLLGKVRDKLAVPILCATVGLVVLAALLATASRGGWLAALVASAVVLAMASRLPAAAQPALLRRGKHHSRLILAGVVLVAVLCLASLFTSTASRGEADSRLGSAVYHESLGERTAVARQSFPMIRDFPLFGVGLGAWPEIYPKYEPPPWDGVFMNEVHNEYVQFVAESGLLGLLLGGGFLLLCARLIGAGVMGVGAERFPIAAACAGALAAIAVHSLFDFPLRIPANALLATVSLALLVGLCARSARAQPHQQPAPARRPWARAGAAVATLAAIAASVATVSQPRRPFPYDLSTPRSIDEAINEIIRYPANPRLHVVLAQLLTSRAQRPMRAAEIEAALALEPTNPGARDLRAAELMTAGDTNQALDQLKLSLFNSPSIATHSYLSGRMIPWLSRAEQDAIITGFKRAAAAGYWPAVDSLALFYENLPGRSNDEAEFLAQAATSAKGKRERSRLLTRAGAAFIDGGKRARAAEVLRAAIAADPRNPDAYRYLAAGVYGQDKKIAEAREVIRQGIAAGAPAAALYQALAEAEIANRDMGAAEAALEQAARIEPYNFALALRLGDLYASDNKFDRAVLWLRKASPLNPESGQAVFDLAQAEEANYQFAAADRDYSRAIARDGGNLGYRARYADFKKRVAQNTSQ